MSFIISVLLISVVVYTICKYNFFKSTAEQIKQEKSGIDVALAKRFDTLNKMRDTVKGYAGHEKATFTEVTRFRKGMSVDEMVESEASMSKAFGEINAIVENYPELRSSSNFMMLQQSITETEDDLQASRRSYNATVSEYNKAIDTFPSCLIAKLAKAEKADFFEASSTARRDVDMSF